MILPWLAVLWRLHIFTSVGSGWRSWSPLRAFHYFNCCICPSHGHYSKNIISLLQLWALMWRNMHNLHYADKSLGRNLTYCYGNGSSEANLFIYFFFFSLNALAWDLSSHSNNIFFYSFIYLYIFFFYSFYHLPLHILIQCVWNCFDKN